jgi:hypothetical protein
MERCLPEHCPTQEGLYLVNWRYRLWTRGRPPRACLGLAHCNPAPRLQVPASSIRHHKQLLHTTHLKALELSWRPSLATLLMRQQALVAEIKATPEVFPAF